jgi:mRNA-degrading endonuclease RelE of RelBE toxin-antitoxin system
MFKKVGDAQPITKVYEKDIKKLSEEAESLVQKTIQQIKEEQDKKNNN